MSTLKFIVVACLIYAGFLWFQKPDGRLFSSQGAATATDSAFAAVPPAAGQDPRTVYVVAAQNCTRDAAQRADGLARDLASQGIRVVRTHNVSFPVVEGGDMARLNAIMNGTLPIVFYGGRAAANPSLEQVVAEVRR